MIRRENFKRFLCVAFWLAMIVFAFGRIGHAADYTVTQTGSGADYSAATFNALTGDKGGNTYYFSGTFTTRISVTAAYGNATSPMVLDGYQAGDCDPINSTCTSSAVLSQGLEVGNGTHGPDYLTIQDFRMTRTSSTLPGFRLYGYLAGTEAQQYVDHCIIQRNHVYETYGTLFYWYNGRYNVIQNNKFTHFGQGGTDTTQGVNLINLDNSVLSGNEIGHDEANYPSGCTSSEMVELHGCNYLLIEYNDIYGAPNQSGLRPKESFGGNSYVVVRFNKIHDSHSKLTSGEQRGKGIGIHSRLDSPNSYFYIYGNHIFRNYAYGVSLGDAVSNIYLWSNILSTGGYHNLMTWTTGGVGLSGPSNVYAYNNTITRGGTLDPTNIDRSGIVLTAGSGFNIKNNLLWNNHPGGESSRYYQIYSTKTITSMEHNTLFHSSGTAGYYYGGAVRSLATMQSSYGFENDSPAGAVEDPLFTDPDGADNTYGTEDDDYTLTASSPAIDDGATLLGTYTVALSGGDAWFETQTGYATISMTGAEALSPDTDWTGQPSVTKILTADRTDTGWDRGAYAFEVVAPNGVITSPVGNQTIEEGESLTFTSDVTCTTSTPCTQLWNFDGGAVNSTSEDAGATAFATAGVYNVTLTVTDAASVADPTPAQVTVTVRTATGANNYTGNTNVKGLWVFENNLNDTSGNSNNLTGSGSPAYDSSTEIEGDYSLDLEAESSQYASIADASLSSGFPFKSDTVEAPWTLLAKFRLESLPTAGARMIIASKYGYTANLRSFYLGVEDVDGTTYPTFAIGYAGGVSNEPEFHGSAVTAGVNYAIALVFDNATDEYTFALYNLDTSAVVGTNATGDLTSTVNGGWCNTAASFDIGKIGPNNTYYFDGLIDEVVVLSQEFSTTEISAYFAGNYSVSTAEIVRIYSSTPTGYYKEGDTTAPFFVEFADAISWAVGAGSIKLTLVNDTGDDVAVDATYASGSGSTIEFDGLVVPDGFNTADLDAVTLAAAGGATIKVSGTTTDADLTVPTDPDSRSLDRNGRIVIDDTADTIASVVGISDDASSFTDPDGYIDIAVNFPSTDGYHVGYTTAWPKVGLAVGAETLYAEYVGKTDANTLVFRLELAPGNRDPDGIEIAGDLVLTGATLTDMAGNTISLTMPASPNTLADDSTYVLAVPKNLATATAWWVGTGFDAATFDLLDLVDGDRILIAE